MKTKWMGIARWLGVVLLQAACMEAPQARDVEASTDDDDVDLEVEERTATLTTSACPDTQWVARIPVAKAGNCALPPAIAGKWTAKNVLEDGTPFLEGDGGDIGVELQRYCSYAWKGVSPPLAVDVTALKQAAPTASKNCKAMMPQTDVGMGTLLGPVLAEMWSDRIGRVREGELVGANGSTEDQREPVTVAVVDTMPTTINEAPTVMHGEVMARIIEDIACPTAGPCAVNVVRVLGLPRITVDTVDLVRGGFAGLYSDTAAGVSEAVRRWSLQQTPSKLIISLSLGWDGDLFPETRLANPPPSITMIRDVLEYARCRGAIIVAAAGNDTGTCTDGPLFPAAYEQLPAPTQNRCAQLGVLNAPVLTGPLVHAAGGTALGGGLLPSAREGGIPRLVALSDHVVTDSAPHQLVTGSSVSVANVVGGLALAWSYASDRTPQQIVDDLHDGGVPTGHTADFGVLGAVEQVTRLDVCGALAEACEHSSVCPDFTAACVPGAVVGPPLSALQVDVTPDHTLTSVFADTVAEPCEATCGAETVAWDDDSVDACDATQRDPMAPLVGPQPGIAPCPHCTIKTKTTLRASLSPDVDPAAVTDVFLELYDDNGEITRMGLGDLPLELETITEMDLSPEKVPPTLPRATITVVAGEKVFTNDLLLVE